MGVGIILSTLFSSAMGTSISNPTIEQLEKFNSTISIESAKLHERELIQQNLTNDDGGCSLESIDPFFKFTIDNLLESQAIEAYAEWVYDHALKDLELQQHGEVGLFGLRVLNDATLHCGKEPCSPKVKCNEMRELIEGGKRDEARRRYVSKFFLKISCIFQTFRANLVML